MCVDWNDKIFLNSTSVEMDPSFSVILGILFINYFFFQRGVPYITCFIIINIHLFMINVIMYKLIGTLIFDFCYRLSVH